MIDEERLDIAFDDFDKSNPSEISKSQAEEFLDKHMCLGKDEVQRLLSENTFGKDGNIDRDKFIKKTVQTLLPEEYFPSLVRKYFREADSAKTGKVSIEKLENDSEFDDKRVKDWMQENGKTEFVYEEFLQFLKEQVIKIMKGEMTFP